MRRPSGGGRDQTAISETGEVLGQVRPGGAKAVGELGRAGGSSEKLDDDAASSAVGQGGADPVQHPQIDP
jgi:hypothetical protein